MNYLYENDIGIRGIEASFVYSEDVSGYDFTIEWKNTVTRVSGTWIPDSVVYSGGTHTVKYVPTETLTAGGYVFTIEVKSGSNEFNVGPYYFSVHKNR